MKAKVKSLAACRKGEYRHYERRQQRLAELAEHNWLTCMAFLTNAANSDFTAAISVANTRILEFTLQTPHHR